MSTFAKETTVPAERSRAEIERVLLRYGADQFSSAWTNTPNGQAASIAFRAKGRIIKFTLALPGAEEPRFQDLAARARSRTAQYFCDQEVRQRWRALLLVIRAKLEAVESGISTFEQEFLANVMLPNGETVGAFMVPYLELAYRDGAMPKLLTEGGDRG